MTRIAKIFAIDHSQLVRLRGVFIRKEGEEAVLSPRFADWPDYLARAPIASPDFMENVEELPMQERSR